jgi:hypothetical protein
MHQTIAQLETRLGTMVHVEATVEKLEHDLAEKVNIVESFKTTAEHLTAQLSVASSELARMDGELTTQRSRQADAMATLAETQNKSQLLRDSRNPLTMLEMQQQLMQEQQQPENQLHLRQHQHQHQQQHNQHQHQQHHDQHWQRQHVGTVRPAQQPQVTSTDANQRFQDTYARTFPANTTAPAVAGHRHVDAAPPHQPPTPSQDAAGTMHMPSMEATHTVASPAAQRQSQALGQVLLESLAGEDWFG